MTTHGSRADGMFCSSSRVTLVDVPVFFASMTGVCRRHLDLLLHAADGQRGLQLHGAARDDRDVRC